jgi:hypothetical protein
MRLIIDTVLHAKDRSRLRLFVCLLVSSQAVLSAVQDVWHQIKIARQPFVFAPRVNHVIIWLLQVSRQSLVRISL